MSVNTTNAYGNIYISDDAIASVVAHTAKECYGVAGLTRKKFIRNPNVLDNYNFEKEHKDGVKILTLDNKIYVDIFVVLVNGVSLNAVCTSIRKTVKYKVEMFTGMVVDSVNIRVMGITNKVRTNVINERVDEDIPDEQPIDELTDTENL